MLTQLQCYSLFPGMEIQSTTPPPADRQRERVTSFHPQDDIRRLMPEPQRVEVNR